MAKHNGDQLPDGVGNGLCCEGVFSLECEWRCDESHRVEMSLEHFLSLVIAAGNCLQ